MKKLLPVFCAAAVTGAAIVTVIKTAHAGMPALAPNEMVVTTVTSNADEVVNEFRLKLAPNGDLDGLRICDSENDCSNWTMQQLRQGASMNKKGTDRVILKLKCPTCVNAEGGDVTLSILHEGAIFKAEKRDLFRKVNLKISRPSGASPWQISVNEKTGLRQFNKLHMLKNTWLGAVCGIKTLIFSMGKNEVEKLKAEDLPEEVGR